MSQVTVRLLYVLLSLWWFTRQGDFTLRLSPPGYSGSGNEGDEEHSRNGHPPDQGRPTWEADGLSHHHP